MKKIMILGAGIYQVPLIKKAKEMGLYTIVLSIPGNYPGFELADKTYYCNTSDKVGALEIAEKEAIDAICTTGTDVAVSTIGYVNTKMGLCGISEDAANCTTDKVKMQKAFHDGGVRAAEYVVVRSAQEAIDAARKIGLPVVVKCVDSSGSRGITTVFEEKDIAAAFEESIKYSRQDYVLVEERLGGEELCISGFVQDAKVAFLAPHRKYSVKKDNIPISIGHSFPYHCDQKTLDNIAAEMQKVVDATGIDSCAFNADAFDDNGEISIIEVGGRAGATCIPELIAIHYGVDYYKMVIDNALGNSYEVSLKEERVPCMAKLLMSPIAGTITKIDYSSIEALRGENTQIQLDYAVGDEVEAMANGTNRIGHVVAPTDDDNEHCKIVNAVYESIYVNDKSLKSLWEN